MKLLFCPYCGDGPKAPEDAGCCGESSAHFVEKDISETLKGESENIYRALKRLVKATAGSGPQIFYAARNATNLIEKIEGAK